MVCSLLLFSTKILFLGKSNPKNQNSLSKMELKILKIPMAENTVFGQTLSKKSKLFV